MAILQLGTFMSEVFILTGETVLPIGGAGSGKGLSSMTLHGVVKINQFGYQRFQSSL